jgi:hypothetical protein
MGLRDELMKYCERLVRWASDHWAASGQQGLAAPVHRWVLPGTPSLAFTGVSPGGTTPIAGAIGGINEEHLRLAERMRRRRAGLPDVDVADSPGLPTPPAPS